MRTKAKTYLVIFFIYLVAGFLVPWLFVSSLPGEAGLLAGGLILFLAPPIFVLSATFLVLAISAAVSGRSSGGVSSGGIGTSHPVRNPILLAIGTTLILGGYFIVVLPTATLFSYWPYAVGGLVLVLGLVDLLRSASPK